MHPLILVFFIGLFLHDALLAESSGVSQWPLTRLGWPWIVVIMLVPKLLLGAVYHLQCRRVFKRLGDAASQRRLRKLERFSKLLGLMLIFSFFADLSLGGLEWLRDRPWFGDFVLLDELLFLLPTLAVIAWTWSSYYPLDIAMREAALMGRLDAGKPVQLWTRPQYMISNVRHQWVLMGVPLLLLAAWSDVVQRFIAPNLDWSEVSLQLLQTGGALVVFVFTSVMIRYLWDTVPLPDGELRRSLMGMCKQYRVGVRELLLWRTFGGVVNGAVMGLFGWVRYILLTDALLDSLTPRQVQAVMAHELAHVRKHHMFWMVVVAAGSLELFRFGWTFLFDWTFEAMSNGSLGNAMPDPVLSAIDNPNMPMLSGLIVSIACWFFLFGWVSRRFERQADTFAVQHIAREHHASDDIAPAADLPIVITAVPDGGSTVGSPGVPLASIGSDAWFQVLSQGRLPAASVEQVADDRIPLSSSNVMIGALQAVAGSLNCIPTTRPSWRHGSIKWRQDYLRELAGKTIDDTDIDRQVLWIKVASVLTVGALVLLYMLAGA